MRHRTTVGHRARNDVLAKIVIGCRVHDVTGQFRVQIFGIEHVHPHAAQRHIGPARHRRRIGGFFDKIGDHAALINRHDPETTGLMTRHFDARHRAFGTALDMVDQHDRIIHLIDVVAGENDDELGCWRIGLEDIDILVNRVCRTAIPGFLVDTLLCRKQVDKLVDFAMQEIPSALQMTQEAMRLVLRDHADAPNLRVDAVRQGEIDNPELAAEMHRRLRAAIREFVQAAAAPAGKNQCNRLAWQLERLSVNHLCIPSELVSSHQVAPPGVTHSR